METVISVWTSVPILHHKLWSSLIQVIACHLVDSKPLCKSILIYCELKRLGTNFSEIFMQKTKIFFLENAFGYVICKMAAILFWPHCDNSLRLSDIIWQHRSGSTSAQVMACCLMAPSHYLNQCWLTVFTKIIGHVGHFRWLGPNVRWEIWRILIEYIKPIGQMSDESWKFFGYTDLSSVRSSGIHLRAIS